MTKASKATSKSTSSSNTSNSNSVSKSNISKISSGQGKKIVSSSTTLSRHDVRSTYESNTEFLSSYAAALPGTIKLFNAQKKGTKGLQKLTEQHSKRKKSIIPSKTDYIAYQQFLNKLNSSYLVSTDNSTMASVLYKQDILKSYEKHLFTDWLWSLQVNHNLLLYGIGSKSRLLRLFVKKCLDGEDVLLISGKVSLTNNNNDKNNSKKRNSSNSSYNANSNNHNDSNSSHALHSPVGGGGVSDMSGTKPSTTSTSNMTTSQIMKSLLDTIASTILRLPANASDGLENALNEHYGRGADYGSKFKLVSRHNKTLSTVAVSVTIDNTSSGVNHKSTSNSVNSTYKNDYNGSSSSSNHSHNSRYSDDNNNDEEEENEEENEHKITTIPRDSSNNSQPSLQQQPSTAVISSLRNHATRRYNELLDEGKLKEMDPNWGKRYVHAQARLYIVIDSIDGELLCGHGKLSSDTDEAMLILSLLAECPSISIVATCNTMNTPLLWTPAQLLRFRWQYISVPTYESFVMELVVCGQLKLMNHNKKRRKDDYQSDLLDSLDENQNKNIEKTGIADNTTIKNINSSSSSISNTNIPSNKRRPNNNNVVVLMASLSARHRELLLLFIKTCIQSTDAVTVMEFIEKQTRSRLSTTSKPINKEVGKLSKVFINAEQEGDMDIEYLSLLATKQLLFKNMKETIFFLKELVDQKLLTKYTSDRHKERVKSSTSLCTLAMQLKSYLK